MQLTPVSFLTTQCRNVTDWLEALQARNPARIEPQHLFGISGLSSDLQRLYAVELILADLTTETVQAEVAEAIGNLVETIAMTYHSRCCQPVRPVVSRKRMPMPHKRQLKSA